MSQSTTQAAAPAAPVAAPAPAAAGQKDAITAIREAVIPVIKAELDAHDKYMNHRLVEMEARIIEEVRMGTTQINTFISSQAGATRKVKKTETKDDVAAGAAGSPAVTPADPAAATPTAPATKPASFRPKNLWFRDQYQASAEFREKFTEAALKVDPNFKTLMEGDKKVSSKAEDKRDAARSEFAYNYMVDKMQDWGTKVYIPMHEAAKRAAQPGTKSETAKVDTK